MPSETPPLTMMEHPSIDESLVPERYVAGQLSPEESARFEEHFFECARCLESVETVRRFREDLRRLPPAEIVPSSGRRIDPTTLLLAASLLVAVPAAVFFYRSDRGARRELETLRLRAASATPSTPAPGPGAIEAARTLASAPLAASVFTLNLTRGGSSEPESRIVVGGSEHWVVLLFDAPDEIAPGPYRVMLATADGRPVGGPIDAATSSGGMLAASFPSTLLPPGDYALVVGKGALAPSDRLATYRFRAARTPAP